MDLPLSCRDRVISAWTDLNILIVCLLCSRTNFASKGSFVRRIELCQLDAVGLVCLQQVMAKHLTQGTISQVIRLDLRRKSRSWSCLASTESEPKQRTCPPAFK